MILVKLFINHINPLFINFIIIDKFSLPLKNYNYLKFLDYYSQHFFKKILIEKSFIHFSFLIPMIKKIELINRITILSNPLMH